MRNPHRVFADGRDFIVESEDRRGALYWTRVPGSIVAAVRSVVAGGEVAAADAAEMVEPYAREIGLPYTYGYKLRYYVQDVLIILVARGDATLRKDGRGYMYTVDP